MSDPRTGGRHRRPTPVPGAEDPLRFGAEATAPIHAAPPARTFAKPPVEATFDEPEEFSADHLDIPRIPPPRALTGFLWCWVLAGAATLAGNVLPLFTRRAEILETVRDRVDDTSPRPSEADHIAEMSMIGSAAVLTLLVVISMLIGLRTRRGRRWARTTVIMIGVLVLGFHAVTAVLFALRPDVLSSMGTLTTPPHDVWAMVTVALTLTALVLMSRRGVRDYFRDMRFR